VKLLKAYPQLRLMFWGMFLSTIGSSAIWPFLLIYVRQTLNLPLSRVTILNTINAFMALSMAFLAGPLADRLGRKWMIVASLTLNGLAYFLLSRAVTFPQFAVLMALSGAVNPLYRVGADAMVADLIPREQRVDAYALMRMVNNAGISVCPALVGFIATRSYTLAFYCATAGLVTYGLMMAIFAKETLPETLPEKKAEGKREPLAGYVSILRDVPFTSFVFTFTLVQFCAVLIWMLLGVYAKENFGITEQYYGWIATTNALMVVTLQLGITRLSRRFATLPVMVVGSIFYTAAVTSIAWGTGFWYFWISMVVMTIGEMLLMPTSSTFVANLAPPDKRGRYMSIYSLTWGMASGTAPLLGGFLNDNLGPRFIWFGGGMVGSISILGFILLLLLTQRRKALSAAP